MTKYSVLVAGLLIFMCGRYLTSAEDAVLRRFRRLIGGQPVPDGRPWMGVLAYKNPSESVADRPYFVVCGCVLIDSRNVLITAHCLDDDVTPIREDENLFVVLGLVENKWSADRSNIQELEIDCDSVDVVVNNNYVVTNTAFRRDIALIQTVSPVTINEFVSPLQLPPEDFDEAEIQCDFFGWGVISENVETPDFSDTLRTAPVSLVSRSECNPVFFGALRNDHICAAGDASPCFGDSGSPIVCTNNLDTFVVGINSFRRSGPCTLDKPQVYTRIRRFLRWIRRQIARFAQ